MFITRTSEGFYRIPGGGYNNFGFEPYIAKTLEDADAYCDKWYLPKYPRPIKPYVPLMVTPVQSKRNEGESVAFIGKQLCFFEKGEPMPAVGHQIEVMITRPLHRKAQDGMWDYKTSFLALLLRPVTVEWARILHNGFECSGSMCSTTARIFREDDPKFIGPWLTPGRTQIFEASNVNAGSTWKQPYVARRPGYAYVNSVDLMSGKFPLRIEGLANPDDLMYSHLVRK